MASALSTLRARAANASRTSSLLATRVSRAGFALGFRTNRPLNFIRIVIPSSVN
jgi:hypothetical protein